MEGARPKAEANAQLGAIDREPTDGTDAAMDAFLHPRAIAVVGASSDADTISGLLFANLIKSGFEGTILPVNKKHAVVQGVVSYPDLASCPVVADLVIVCVPAGAACGVVAEAGDLGIKAVCVISAGFAETGSDGAALQDGLVKEASARAVRLVGPNCTGILSGSLGGRFNATFSRTVPPPGRTSLVSQSGAIGLAVLEACEVRGLGIGGFVSVGNSVDVASNDLLKYWGQDSTTDLVLLYLESIPDPRAFVRVASEVSRRIPIVAVKAGRTEAGRRGAASHTAALAAGELATDAVLHQAGVIRADSIEEMVDLATVLSARRTFRGRRVAILTNGGGPGVLAADACESNGLAVPELNEPATSALRALLPKEASVSNPVDMIAAATASEYGQAVRILGEAPEIDAVIVMFNTPLITRASEVAAELIAAASEFEDDRALITVFMNKDGPPQVLRAAGVPSFTFPENAVRALGRAISWAERHERPPGRVIRPDVDAEAVSRLMVQAMERSAGAWMTTDDAEALLGAYGVSVPRTVRVRTPEQAAAAQAELGCTAVVKVAAAIHKSDVGGVRLGVNTPAGAAEAVCEIRADLESAGLAGMATKLIVQEQLESGQEMIVGVNRDQVLGPLVMVGLGGKLVEMLEDVAIRVAPISDADIGEMLQSLRSYRLLSGYRGTPPLDIDALAQVLQRVSAIVEDVPEIAEMDLNPVFVLEKGAVAADIRIRLVGAQRVGEAPGPT
ncbi:MAG: acetate--CoA ligase family protein [Acidimicrobiales bacterium]